MIGVEDNGKNMKMFATIVMALLLLTSNQYLWASEPNSDSAEKKASRFIENDSFDSLMAPFLQKGFVGTVIVANKNGPIYKKSAGFAIEGSELYSSSTVLDIASVSKQFTAAAIMKLVEQNKLDLTAPISRYIQDVPKDKRSITIHHLLTHSAGYKRHLGRDEESLNRESFLNKALALPLTFEVGKKYHYSNIGYGLLAYIVEKVSSQDFETFLFENLFKPAGMFSTGYLRPDWSDRTIPEVKRLYAGFSSPLKMLESTKGNFWNLKGSGGIFSTAEDMALWHVALSNEAIMQNHLKCLMYTPHVSEGEEGYYYGYGWSIVPRVNKERIVWHNGMSFFGKAELWRLPKSGMMVFVASHDPDVNTWSVANALFDAIKENGH